MTVDPYRRAAVVAVDREAMRAEVLRYLAEDVGSGDVTTERIVPAGMRACAWMVAREALVVAGLDLATQVFLELDGSLLIKPAVSDGACVGSGARLVFLSGRAAPILTGERVALNLLQHLSGIATLTRHFADALAGTGASVSDTRKTTPGLRLLEKYAVRVGGGRNHRMGLADAILIKDNHIAAAGGVGPALRAARARGAAGMPIQVEVDGLAQLADALDAGVDAVLLDNMTPAAAAEAVRLIRARPSGASCWIEASGGITLSNVRAYAEAGVDTISVGALTHSAPAVDIALDLEPAPPQDRSHDDS